MNGLSVNLKLQRAVVLFITTAFVIGLSLWFSAQVSGLGFPLDDAWIHQTYARNLAARGEWAFMPGRPSAGSTSPLWTIALSLGHIIGIEPRAWSYFLGGILLFATAWIGGDWFATRLRNFQRWYPWVGMLLVLEWHLVWASVSGMEILALAFLAVWVLSRLDMERWNAVGIGALVGLGVWIRPDAVSLLIPIFWNLVCRSRGRITKSSSEMVAVGFGFLLLFVPYLVFNHALSGAWWPSTFYAKQAEYAVMREGSFLRRMFSLFSLPFVGTGVLLIPGILHIGWKLVRQRAWSRSAPLVWVVVFLVAYAWRLPLTYQHGRYAMPIIPIVLILGLEGMFAWAKPRSSLSWMRVLSRTWVGAVVVVAIVFLLMGLQAYARDVALIETEMVRSAQWIATNTEPDALVAAHDIGALGYFGERSLLDLAGLVSPEVIPILRDERALASYLDVAGANYLMTFPDWYPQLVLLAEPVYVTGAEISPLLGGENMVVYKWASGGLPHE